MSLASALNAAGVVVAFGGSPRKGALLVTADLADDQTPFHTAETFPVPHGPDFAVRAQEFVAARTKEVADRHGLAEIFVQASETGQLRVVVFAADRASSATWHPFRAGPIAGSWA